MKATKPEARRRRPGVVLLVTSMALAWGVWGTGRAGAAETLAEVDGAAITLEEVDRAIGEPLRKLEEQIYQLRRQRVEAFIAERLLERAARERGLSVTALLDAEVTPKVGLVTEQEIEQFYQANKARIRVPNDAALRDRIRTHLQAEKLAAQRSAFVQSLRAGSKVVVRLAPPAVARVEVSTTGAPAKGQPTAPVTIVKFEDFHCPYCKTVQAQFAEIQARYGERVRLVHRDFPIDELHPAARGAHEAARCAGEQGKFWEYHALLYQNAPRAAPEDLKGFAREAGLEPAAFQACLDERRYRAAVQQDIEEGKRAGVTGTPTFFVNGRLLSGALPVSRFVEVIEDELARPR
jgi:protein-disulfide isomerase